MRDEAFEASYQRLFGSGIQAAPSSDALIHDFYQRFFAASPAVAHAFRNTDMNRQVSALRSSLHDLVNFHLTGILGHRLRRVAERHRHMDFPVELYDLWLDCIVAAAADRDPAGRCVHRVSLAPGPAPGVTYMKLWHGSERSPLDGP
ncbi:MAG: globin [Gammaproteobacteria bacterium]|nr:globin [Gammaproteobacteria bacterium]